MAATARAKPKAAKPKAETGAERAAREEVERLEAHRADHSFIERRLIVTVRAQRKYMERDLSALTRAIGHMGEMSAGMTVRAERDDGGK